MLPYFLGFPTALILCERLLRLYRACTGVMATLELNDDETTVITFEDPKGRSFNFSAGQYVLVQVKELSWFQFHPFTVSSCRGPELQVTSKIKLFLAHSC
jgi:predicted ferric reductase